ncbi:hypothetical protein IWX49DRAFT_556137 [Phyllosticta citricarpa]|uniref:Uncharacterized protein n=1 Tax=Phyllosticta paracitricarpa TaxID=2016321 RepID=A0ABR1MRX1_9PEZI
MNPSSTCRHCTPKYTQLNSNNSATMDNAIQGTFQEAMETAAEFPRRAHRMFAFRPRTNDTPRRNNKRWIRWCLIKILYIVLGWTCLVVEPGEKDPLVNPVQLRLLILASIAMTLTELYSHGLELDGDDEEDEEDDGEYGEDDGDENGDEDDDDDDDEEDDDLDWVEWRNLKYLLAFQVVLLGAAYAKSFGIPVPEGFLEDLFMGLGTFLYPEPDEKDFMWIHFLFGSWFAWLLVYYPVSLMSLVIFLAKLLH